MDIESYSPNYDRIYNTEVIHVNNSYRPHRALLIVVQTTLPQYSVCKEAGK